MNNIGEFYHTCVLSRHVKIKSKFISMDDQLFLSFTPSHRRAANWYFTIVAGLSLTPYSPVRASTCWLPLGIVLGVSLFKEAVEDFKRYQTDVEVNNRWVEVMDARTGAFATRKWKEVGVGEVVQVNKDEQFPADLLFLTAETEEGNCYIETMNLDGETNLKNKQCVGGSSRMAA